MENEAGLDCPSRVGPDEFRFGDLRDDLFGGVVAIRFGGFDATKR